MRCELDADHYMIYHQLVTASDPTIFYSILRRAAPGWMPEATSCWRDWPFALIFSREMSPSAGAPGAASRRGWFVLTTSGGPGDGGATSRGAPFRTETGTFLFWAVHWGMSDRYIVGFARLVYCYYCFTDLSKLFCGTYNIDICMTIWHLLLTVFCPDKAKWCISSMMCSWKLLKYIVQRCIWREINFVEKQNKNKTIFYSYFAIKARIRTAGAHPKMHLQCWNDCIFFSLLN